MAGQAVLPNRLVLPKQRAALLRVTIVAGLIDGEFLQQLRPGRAVRIVAVGANHQALADRMMRELVAVGPLFRVTGEALLRLRELHQNRILRHMDRVAIVARQIVALMLAALPVHSETRLMATQALRVAFRDRRDVRSFEDDRRARRLHRGVVASWAMARFAAVLTERAVRIALHRVRCLQNRRDFRVDTMTGETGSRAPRREGLRRLR